MIRIEDLVYSSRQLASVRPARCDRIHLLGSGIGIDRKTAGWMRADAAGFWKAECIAIGDQDGFPQLARGRGSAVYHSTG